MLLFAAALVVDRENAQKFPFIVLLVGVPKLNWFLNQVAVVPYAVVTNINPLLVLVDDITTLPEILTKTIPDCM